MTTDFSGSWVYRSFVNNPDMDLTFCELASGLDRMELAVTSNSVSGSLGGGGWILELDGKLKGTKTQQLVMSGTGTIGGELGALPAGRANGIHKIMKRFLKYMGLDV